MWEYLQSEFAKLEEVGFKRLAKSAAIAFMRLKYVFVWAFMLFFLAVTITPVVPKLDLSDKLNLIIGLCLFIILELACGIFFVLFQPFWLEVTDSIEDDNVDVKDVIVRRPGS